MNNLNYVLKILNVFKYKDRGKLDDLKEKLSELYENKDVYITLNGRSAIYLFLKSLDLKEGSRVAVQAFTCNAVINPILSLGLKPLYVDINSENFNMDYDSFVRKLDDSVKVVILQHTFGLPADQRIVRLCKENNIYILEDCAHTLGEKAFGIDGDAFMLSFGIEKLLPTRVGGALIVNNKNLVSSIDSLVSNQKELGYINTFLWLMHPIIWRVLRLLPYFIQTPLKNILKFIGVLKSGFTKRESDGNASYAHLHTISGVLAEFAVNCLSAFDSIISHRRSISTVYRNQLDQQYFAYIRYPYIAKDVQIAERIISMLNSKGYPSNDRWFEPVVFPKGTNLEKMMYKPGSCPVAEDISSRIINLPTGNNVDENIALEIAKEVLKLK